MIDGLIAGRLMGDASRRTDKAGRGYTVARVLARNKADEEFIVNVIAFDDAACAALLALADGDALSLTGALTPKVWTDKQGITRPSLDLVATQVLTAYHAGRKQAALGANDTDPD
ncbi:MAG: single-stranded DNA-binding protein [Hydrogenophaga sp.]|uniref:single-stranded DNA-binding protein n=1 Tax=Hydrogenophaga sp. TaxID=1904254 RepID=UPI00271BE512|nr:single-stranded DNA-binding protein [Hydrogenophaga sp.]MDO9147181.1 single-stranded DNA-binding protein [Hydrogenophaga sp.]MDO9604055.1 single-stranded DNA-binding protein [Hydrogenophaga sp.]MDP2165940.1 single-stranded DNA-binding protein [Hydrogenophaga sp.]MDP3476183.1 single-stranded DNA-binding protein [Hydrogenophaga sp.]